MSLGWILLIAIGMAGIAAHLIESRRVPKKRERFRYRDPLSVEEIYARYFGAHILSRERFDYLWNTVAATLKLDASRLRPSDRFDHELSPVEGHLVEDELVDLTEFYVNECHKVGIAGNNQKPQTLDEFIRVLGDPAP